MSITYVNRAGRWSWMLILTLSAHGYLLSQEDASVSTTLEDPLHAITAADLEGVDPAQKIQVLAGLATKTHLSAEITAVLMRIIADHQSTAQLRNVAANALLAQEVPPTGIADVFLYAIDDVNDDATWRDYAVQHYARTSSLGSPDRVVNTLFRLVANGAFAQPGTALVQLERLERQGAGISPERLDAATAALAVDSTSALANRVTALAMIGSRGLHGSAPVLREMIRHPDTSPPALLRVAIASLGLIGDVNDVAILQPFMHDADVGLSRAAQGACERLSATVPTSK